MQNVPSFLAFKIALSVGRSEPKDHRPGRGVLAGGGHDLSNDKRRWS